MSITLVGRTWRFHGEEDEFEFGTLRQYDVDRRRRRFLIGQRPLGKEETDQQPC